MLKKWDIIIIVVLIYISFIPELIFGVMINPNYKSNYVELTFKGMFYKKVPLYETQR